MKKILIGIVSVLLFSACVSTRYPAQSHIPLVDAQVKQWISKHDSKSKEKLPIIVKSDGALKGYGFLKLIKENFYGGHASYNELKNLILDTKVVRVYAGKQKLKK